MDVWISSDQIPAAFKAATTLFIFGCWFPELLWPWPRWSLHRQWSQVGFNATVFPAHRYRRGSVTGPPPARVPAGGDCKTSDAMTRLARTAVRRRSRITYPPWTLVLLGAPLGLTRTEHVPYCDVPTRFGRYAPNWTCPSGTATMLESGSFMNKQQGVVSAKAATSFVRDLRLRPK